LALYALDILTLYSFLSVTLITAVVSNGTLLREVKILDNFSIIDRRYRVIIGKILDYSLPLAVVELISIFYNMADIFLIESMLGSEVFARYIYSYKLILATLIFIQPMFNIFWQYVASNFQKNLQQIQTIFYRLLITIFALSTSLIFFLLNFSEDIILLFTDDRYLESANIYLTIYDSSPIAIEKLGLCSSILPQVGPGNFRNFCGYRVFTFPFFLLIFFLLFPLVRVAFGLWQWGHLGSRFSRFLFLCVLRCYLPSQGGIGHFLTAGVYLWGLLGRVTLVCPTGPLLYARVCQILWAERGEVRNCGRVEGHCDVSYFFSVGLDEGEIVYRGDYRGEEIDKGVRGDESHKV